METLIDRQLFAHCCVGSTLSTAAHVDHVYSIYLVLSVHCVYHSSKVTINVTCLWSREILVQQIFPTGTKGGRVRW